MEVPRDLPSGVAFELSGHRGAVLQCVFTAKGNYALSAGADRTVRLWNPRTGTAVKEYEVHGKEVHDLAVSPDNARFASGGADATAALVDVTSGSVVRRWRGHAGKVFAIGMNAQASVVASGSYDATVRLWDARSGSHEPIQTLKHFTDAVMAVVVEKEALVAASVDGSVRTFDLRNAEAVRDALGSPVGNVAVSGDGNCLLAATLDDSLALIDRADGGKLQTYTGHGHANRSARVGCCFSHDDAHVVAGDEGGGVTIWDLVRTRALPARACSRSCRVRCARPHHLRACAACATAAL